MVNLTPFHQVALVPAESFKAVAQIVMLAIAGVAMLLAVRLFKHRDLIGS